MTKIWLKLKSILAQKTKTKSKVAAKNNIGKLVGELSLMYNSASHSLIATFDHVHKFSGHSMVSQ